MGPSLRDRNIEFCTLGAIYASVFTLTLQKDQGIVVMRSWVILDVEKEVEKEGAAFALTS